MTDSMHSKQNRGGKLISFLMLCLILSVALGVVVDGARIAAGLLVIGIGSLGFRFLTFGRKILVSLLATFGLIFSGLGWMRGNSPKLEDLYLLNQTIIAMILAVSFLSIISKPKLENTSGLVGQSAVWRTAAVLHLLGSVINLSVLPLVGDRLKTQGREGFLNSLLISRVYSSAAYWSPFWAAAATALTFAPEANIPTLFIVGLVVAGMSLFFGTLEIIKKMGPELSTYKGFSVTASTAINPLLLVAMVFTSNLVWPEVSTPALVMMNSLALVILALSIREPRQLVSKLLAHANQGLLAMRAEATFFASAGMLTVGLGWFLRTFDISLPFESYGILAACASMTLIILLGALGVHPLISIGIFATILSPLQVEPTLFAMSSMFAWGISAAVSPVSALNLFIMGRYGWRSEALSLGTAFYAALSTAFGLTALAIVGVWLDTGF